MIDAPNNYRLAIVNLALASDMSSLFVDLVGSAIAISQAGGGAAVCYGAALPPLNLRPKGFAELGIH